MGNRAHALINSAPGQRQSVLERRVREERDVDAGALGKYLPEVLHLRCLAGSHLDAETPGQLR